jgi:hypothetical protein
VLVEEQDNEVHPIMITEGVGDFGWRVPSSHASSGCTVLQVETASTTCLPAASCASSVTLPPVPLTASAPAPA